MQLVTLGQEGHKIKNPIKLIKLWFVFFRQKKKKMFMKWIERSKHQTLKNQEAVAEMAWKQEEKKNEETPRLDKS